MNVVVGRLVRGEKVSAIVCMSMDGILDVKTHRGTTKSIVEYGPFVLLYSQKLGSVQFIYHTLYIY